MTEIRPTVAEDSEPQEGQVTLSLYGVPTQVWVTLSNQHGTALKATACQVCDHLHTHRAQCKRSNSCLS